MAKTHHHSIKEYIGPTLIFIGIIILSAVALHSVEEIHYLKGFYPQSFSVEDAYHASLVEVIKVGFVALPILLIIWYIQRVFPLTRKQT